MCFLQHTRLFGSLPCASCVPPHRLRVTWWAKGVYMHACRVSHTLKTRAVHACETIHTTMHAKRHTLTQRPAIMAHTGTTPLREQTASYSSTFEQRPFARDTVTYVLLSIIMRLSYAQVLVVIVNSVAVSHTVIASGSVFGSRAHANACPAGYVKPIGVCDAMPMLVHENVHHVRCIHANIFLVSGWDRVPLAAYRCAPTP